MVDGEPFLRDEGVKVKAERDHVGGELVGGLFEGEADSGPTELCGAADQEFDSEQRLSAPCAAAYERGTRAREPPRVISSRPGIPVGHLARPRGRGCTCVRLDMDRLIENFDHFLLVATGQSANYPSEFTGRDQPRPALYNARSLPHALSASGLL